MNVTNEPPRHQTDDNATGALVSQRDGGTCLQIPTSGAWDTTPRARRRCSRPSRDEPEDCLRLLEASLVAVSTEPNLNQTWDLMLTD